ncbi:amino acid permease [Arthrobacter sp. NEB 688]|uniref:amino acid permease n=1 Tax=Arthrobacter sp. NEB 688 TaxID=904039 RepID=UPI0025712018|nr:amino acid permease [Arthrobacter sp. NEB 688]
MSDDHSVLRTKPVEDVLAQAGGPDGEGGDGAHGPGRLTRTLGPFSLMGFGIGIVIGTGIFTLTGIEAKNHAGPGVVISFVIAGAVSLLAALCYSELASAVPTAGSAYTYAYATIGEVFAWIIGWDLILEFALGAAVVARGWSGTRRSSSTSPPRSSGRSRWSTSARSPSSCCSAWSPSSASARARA